MTSITYTNIHASGKLIHDLHETWAAIAYDVTSFKPGADYTPEEIIGMIIDLGAIEIYGSKESDYEMRELIRTHGYAAVCERLAEVTKFSINGAR